MNHHHQPERICIHKKRAVRCQAGLNTQGSCREAYRNQNNFTVTSLYFKELILHDVTTLFPRHKDLHQNNPRNVSNFIIPAHHFITVCMKRHPPNHLSDHLRREPTKTFMTSCGCRSLKFHFKTKKNILFLTKKYFF